MHFDDRLATVLQMPVQGSAMARIQFRQLLDILARDEQRAEHGDALDAAFARLDELAREIPASERAAVLREPMMRIANPELIEHLAADDPEVAIAAIGAADLSDADWLDLIPELPVQARGILRHRSDFSPAVLTLLDRLGISDRGLPGATSATAPERTGRPELVVLQGGGGTLARAPMSDDSGGAGIGAIVRRIEEFRKARAGADTAGDSELLPLEGLVRATMRAVDFSTNAAGRIDWAEGALGSSLVGTLLSGLGTHAPDLGQVIRTRQPLRNRVVALPGSPDLAGEWRLDALPQFAPVDGRFLGYAGRLRRSATSSAPALAAAEGDSMRQVLHELRTPANAIQIAAEIIQQQLYGPAPHEYRALAASIAGDTAQILAGFDELDRLVKLENGSQVPAAGLCDLSVIVDETVVRLQAWTAPHGSGFDLPESAPSLNVGIDEEEISRLVWRLLAGLVGLTAPGEALGIGLAHDGDNAVLTIHMPEPMADRLDAAMNGGQPVDAARALSSGMFGIGFTLRLAAAEAAAAGGKLRRVAGTLRLTLPGLTPTAYRHTHA